MHLMPVFGFVVQRFYTYFLKKNQICIYWSHLRAGGSSEFHDGSLSLLILLAYF